MFQPRKRWPVQCGIYRAPIVAFLAIHLAAAPVVAQTIALGLHAPALTVATDTLAPHADASTSATRIA